MVLIEISVVLLSELGIKLRRYYCCVSVVSNCVSVVRWEKNIHLKFLIEQDNEMKVVGMAGDGIEAFELCKQLNPDVVLMDVIMPRCDGVEGTRLIKDCFNWIDVIILSTYSDDKHIINALKNGASGYVLKDVRPVDMITAIKSAANGIRLIHKDAMSALVKTIPVQKSIRRADFNLTDRELSIIKMIIEGKTNKEIAATIFLNEGSVKNIITSILSKMKLKDRTQLAIYSLKNNLVD